MTRAEVAASIEQVGILPAIRVSVTEYAEFALRALHRADIPLAEVTMTIPKAVEVIAGMSKRLPDMIIGAGTVLDTDTARRCLDAGARFLTSPGFVPEVVEFAVKNDVVVFPGALTPSEVIAAWKAGSDFVKIFPCAQVGGHHYIHTLKVPLPQVRMIASGGVNQQTAADFIISGASALGVGSQLVPQEALQRRNETQVHELARRFIHIVKEARARKERIDHDPQPVSDRIFHGRH